MKIIKQGIAPESTPVQGTCHYCKTVIEFMPHEAKFHSHQRDGDSYEIACPTCHRAIWAAKTVVARQNWQRD